jgi:hypothetical protein
VRGPGPRLLALFAGTGYGLGSALLAGHRHILWAVAVGLPLGFICDYLDVSEKRRAS